MRGTRVRIAVEERVIGIIPADAGNTSTVLLESLNAQDHPRGCGEHTATEAPDLLYRGSSPRMRGTLSS